MHLSVPFQSLSLWILAGIPYDSWAYSTVLEKLIVNVHCLSETELLKKVFQRLL